MEGLEAVVLWPRVEPCGGRPGGCWCLGGGGGVAFFVYSSGGGGVGGGGGGGGGGGVKNPPNPPQPALMREGNGEWGMGKEG